MADSNIASLRNKAKQAKIKGNYRDAIDYYKQIIEQDVQDPNITKEIGSLYTKLNNKKKAREFYWKSLEQYRELEYYQNATAIGKILLRLGSDELEVKQELADLYVKQELIGDAVAAFQDISDKYREEGDIEGVLENLRRIVELTPKRAGIRLKLAEIYESQEKFEEALEELKKISRIYEEQGRVEELEDVSARINKISKKVKEEETGEEGEEVGTEVREEEVVFEQEGVGESTEIEESGVEEKVKFEEFEEEVGEEEELEEEEVELTDEGVDFLELEDEAIEAFREIVEPEVEEVEESITDWNDWINLAELYISVGSEEEALEYYRKAAEAQFNHKDYEGAFETYKKIADLRPEGIQERQKMVQAALKMNSRKRAVEAYLTLYECLNKKGNKKEANKLLEKARKISPKSPLIKKFVEGKGVEKEEEVKEKVEKEEVETSEMELEELEEEKVEGEAGEDVSTIDFDELFAEEIEEEEKMTVQVEEKKKAPSLDTLLEQFKEKSKKEISTEDYSSHFDLGITYKEMGLYEEAIKEFKKSMKGKEWLIKSLEMMGKCYELSGEIDKAKKVYKHILISDKIGEEETMAFSYYLGNIYTREKSYKKALNEYKKVIRINPDFSDVKKRIKLINKQLSGKEVEEEITAMVNEDMSSESDHLWDKVLFVEDESDGKKKGDRKEKGKISYI